MVFTYIPMWKPLVCRLENDQKISTFLGLPGASWGLPGISTRWPGRGFSTSAMAGKSKDWKLLEAWRMLASSPWLPLTLHVEPASMEIQHDTPGKRTHTYIIYIWKATYSVYCHHLSHALSQYNNVSLHKATSCPDPADFGKMTTRQHKISFRDILKGLLGRKPQ